MASASIPGDLIVQGRIIAQSGVFSGAFVGNAQVAPDAAIAASKLCHRIFRGHSQSGAAAAATVPIHVASAAGTLQRLAVGAIVAAAGGATVTVNLLKNGASVLGGAVTLDSSTAARGNVLAAITTPAYVAGDFFELVITATAGGGTLPQGLIAEAAFDENPS